MISGKSKPEAKASGSCGNFFGGSEFAIIAGSCGQTSGEKSGRYPERQAINCEVSRTPRRRIAGFHAGGELTQGQGEYGS